MKVKHFKVRNFTSLIDVELSDLPDLVVLIGKNSSGKSNLIDALALLFTEFGPELERSLGQVENFQHLFPNHNAQIGRLREISATISLTHEEWVDLLDANQQIIDVEVEGNDLHVSKRIVETYGGSMFWTTHEVSVGEVEIVSGGSLVNADVTIDFVYVDDQESQDDQNGSNHEELGPLELQADELLSRLDSFLNRSFRVVHTTEDPRSWPDRFAERPTIIDSDRIGELWNLSQSGGMQRQAWSAVARGYEALAPNEQRPAALASSIQMEEGTLTVPIGMTGEGSQAILRLIDHLVRGPQILGIEEPETHLHPAFIKKAGRLLTEASLNGKQLFVCTHSPFLVDQSSLDSFYVVRNEGNGTQVSHMRDFDELRNLLLDIGMRPSDILFCDAILLVDGLSDEVFFDALSNKIGVPLADRHVKVVSANGKSRGKYKIEFWAEVGRDAGLPVYAICDKDGTDEAERAANNGQIPRERCLVLSHGALEDHYPWTALKEALIALSGTEPEAEIAVGQRVKELRTLLSKLAPRNAWKPLLAEEVARKLTREVAESEMVDVVAFLRKISADLDVE